MTSYIINIYNDERLRMKGRKGMTIIGIFGVLMALFQVVFWTFFIMSIVKAVKKSKGSNVNTAQYQNMNRPNGNGAPNRYSTINSHYSQQTMNGNGTGTFIPINSGHTHAYEHKVQPIVEATVHERFEDRKEAYIERKQQMKADLPKTSYSKMEAANTTHTSNSYTQSQYHNYGTNADMVSGAGRNEENIKCKYCGAENIVPRSRTKAYNCYFCREII